MPELMTNVLAEHTYDPVRSRNDSRSVFFLVSETWIGADLDYGSEVREQLQENASRYLA